MDYEQRIEDMASQLSPCIVTLGNDPTAFRDLAVTIARLIKEAEDRAVMRAIHDFPISDVASEVESRRFASCLHDPIRTGYGHTCRKCGLEL